MNDTIETASRTTNATFDYQADEFNVTYVICEIVVAVLAVAGNSLVIYVFRKERRLRRRTNYYIVSLATADLLVGLLGIPFAIMSSIGLPNNLHACLFTVSLLVVLCTISIFCLVAVSVDRYWAILHPMGYSRNVRTKTALVIISICWFAGSVVGFLPLMGWHQGKAENVKCFFLNVMDDHYLVFLYFGTIITPALLLAAFYAHIYRVILKQLRQIVVMNPTKSRNKRCKNLPSSGMIRLLGVQQRNEVKSTQNLAIIVLFFMICWIPLYTVNCIIVFYEDFHVNSTVMFSCIILSHLNSAGNPLLYAYHLTDFRAALKNFFCNLLGIPHENSDKCAGKFTSNYSHHSRMYHESSMRSNVDYPRRPVACPKVGIIVKNSALLAAAPAGKLDRTIWNIAEDSGRDSASSQDSLKDINHHDTHLIIRPATPFKSNNILKEINKAFVNSSSLDGSEDAFVNDFLPDYKDIEETCLSDVLKSHQSSPNKLNNYSKSSPQLSKGVYVVENGVERKNFVNNSTEDKKTSYLCVNNNSPKSSHKLSPYKIVSSLFKSKRKLNRSLSDSDSIKKLNGVVVDYYSVS